jgi:hypothetical protein
MEKQIQDNALNEILQTIEVEESYEGIIEYLEMIGRTIPDNKEDVNKILLTLFNIVKKYDNFEFNLRIVSILHHIVDLGHKIDYYDEAEEINCHDNSFLTILKCKLINKIMGNFDFLLLQQNEIETSDDIHKSFLPYYNNNLNETSLVFKNIANQTINDIWKRILNKINDITFCRESSFSMRPYFVELTVLNKGYKAKINYIITKTYSNNIIIKGELKDGSNIFHEEIFTYIKELIQNEFPGLLKN